MIRPTPRYTLFPYTTLFRSLEATFGQVVGFDSILKNVAHTTNGRYERNLSFKSRISEFHLGVELHRSEEHTSELQSLAYLVCRLLLEKKNKWRKQWHD